MPLKYQNEIDKFELASPCPDNNGTSPNNLEAFRWALNPISHSMNFVPNVIYDPWANLTFNYQAASTDRKCARCGSSYFNSLDRAIEKWEGLSLEMRLKMKYTHVATGVLDATDGIAMPIKNGHFTFYEDSAANLQTKFSIIEQLNVTD